MANARNLVERRGSQKNEISQATWLGKVAFGSAASGSLAGR